MFAKLRKKWWFIVLGVVLVGGGFLYWFTQIRAKEVPVTTVQPEFKDLQKTLSFTGRVDAQQRVRLSFAGAGKIVYMGAKEGDAVARYQTLASIDRRVAQKTLEKQLSLYQTERWDYENAQDDRKDRTLPQEERRLADQDQFALDRSVLDVEIRSVAVEDTRLSTPIAGILVKSPITTTGVHVGLTDTWEVVDPSTLYFRLLVDEVDIDEIKVGQEVVVHLDARPDVALRAVVDTIAFQSIDSSSGTVFPVELRFLDAVNIYDHRVGMNGDADIILAESRGVLVVPITALSLGDDGQARVQLKKADGTFEDRVVEIGIETDTEAEIRSGLSVEDQVVLP